MIVINLSLGHKCLCQISYMSLPQWFQWFSCHTNTAIHKAALFQLDLWGFATSLTQSLRSPHSSSLCSSGNSLWSSSWAALPQLPPQLRFQVHGCVRLRRLPHPVWKSHPAQTCPSQTRASSQRAVSRRTASWAVERQTLWRRCERWVHLKVVWPAIAMVWKVQTVACWRSTSPPYSRGRRILKMRVVTNLEHHSPPRHNPPTKQYRPTPLHRRQQTTNQIHRKQRKLLSALIKNRSYHRDLLFSADTLCLTAEQYLQWQCTYFLLSSKTQTQTSLKTASFWV